MQSSQPCVCPFANRPQLLLDQAMRRRHQTNIVDIAVVLFKVGVDIVLLVVSCLSLPVPKRKWQ